MKTRITLTLDQLTEQERKDLTYLLTDALAEFAKCREPVEEYVSARHNPLRDSISFRDKAVEVLRRVELAKKLKLAAHDMIVVDLVEELLFNE